MSLINFDATQFEPSTGKDPVPAGKYIAAIVESTMKPTKSGNGQYLEIEYQILDGEHKGRKLWSRHTLVHVNPQTSATAHIADGPRSRNAPPPSRLGTAGRGSPPHGIPRHGLFMMELRPYQREAVAAVYQHLAQRDDNPCVVIPTGGGKSPILGSICADVVEKWN
nr:DUF669 domain-containing protein [Planctomycetota bacterium]